MKKLAYIFSGFIIGIILIAMLPVSAAIGEYVINANRFPIYVEDTLSEVEAYNIDGYTYLKLADVGKVLGAGVKFNEVDSQIEITKDAAFKPVELLGIKGYNKDNDMYISLSDAVANKDRLMDMMGVSTTVQVVQVVETAAATTHPDIAPITSYEPTTIEGMRAVIYNGETYVEMDALEQKYNWNNPSSTITIALNVSEDSSQDNYTLTNNVTQKSAVFYINQQCLRLREDGGYRYYFNYNMVKSIEE